MVSIEKTRAVVEEGETYDGKIIPTVKAEINRPVRIYENATVKGSIYGQTVALEGGTVSGSIMASESIEFDDGTVDGEVGTDGRVVGSGVTVHGTVTGKRIRLEDSVILGNVVGADVILENCAVIGIVTAERNLTIDDGLCYTFKSYGQTRLTEAATVLPQAIVEGELKLTTPVSVTGLGELEVEEGTLPQMDKTDIVTVDDSTYLSLSPRILNLEKVTDRLDELEKALQRVVAASSAEEVPPINDMLETLGVDKSEYPDVI